MTTMRGRVAAMLIGASFVAAPLSTAAVASPASAVAELACKKAKIAGQNKCIAAGQFCKKAAEKDYNRYGFTCNKKDRNGRWHLQVK